MVAVGEPWPAVLVIDRADDVLDCGLVAAGSESDVELVHLEIVDDWGWLQCDAVLRHN